MAACCALIVVSQMAEYTIQCKVAVIVVISIITDSFSGVLPCHRCGYPRSSMVEEDDNNIILLMTVYSLGYLTFWTYYVSSTKIIFCLFSQSSTVIWIIQRILHLKRLLQMCGSTSANMDLSITHKTSNKISNNTASTMINVFFLLHNIQVLCFFCKLYTIYQLCMQY